jgi:hypothetical protein
VDGAKAGGGAGHVASTTPLNPMAMGIVAEQPVETDIGWPGIKLLHVESE